MTRKKLWSVQPNMSRDWFSSHVCTADWLMKYVHVLVWCVRNFTMRERSIVSTSQSRFSAYFPEVSTYVVRTYDRTHHGIDARVRTRGLDSFVRSIIRSFVRCFVGRRRRASPPPFSSTGHHRQVGQVCDLCFLSWVGCLYMYVLSREFIPNLPNNTVLYEMRLSPHDCLE